MINWKVRFRNRKWVISFVSQILLVAQMFFAGLNELGITDIQLTEQFNSSIIMFVNSVLVLLAMLGVVQDPTTKGFSDSERAKKYVEPD